MPAVISSRVLSKNDHRGDVVFLMFPSPQQAAVATEGLQLAEVDAAAHAVVCSSGGLLSFRPVLSMLCFAVPQLAAVSHS